MAHHPLPPPISSAAMARAILDDLATLARRGPVGGLTVLCHVATMRRHLLTLAEYERTLDELTDEAMEQARAVAAAQATGNLVQFPHRPRHASTGGTAA